MNMLASVPVVVARLQDTGFKRHPHTCDRIWDQPIENKQLPAFKAHRDSFINPALNLKI